MSWKPDEEEKKYIELVMSMSSDCLLGRGTSNLQTFCENLNLIAGRLLNLKEKCSPDTKE